MAHECAELRVVEGGAKRRHEAVLAIDDRAFDLRVRVARLELGVVKVPRRGRLAVSRRLTAEALRTVAARTRGGEELGAVGLRLHLGIGLPAAGSEGDEEREAQDEDDALRRGHYAPRSGLG